MFGKKKPTIFDENQDKALKAMAKNQTVLITNNNQFLKDKANHWAWIVHLKKRVEALEAADAAFKKADAEFDKRLQDVGASLFNAAKTKTEEVTVKT